MRRVILWFWAWLNQAPIAGFLWLFAFDWNEWVRRIIALGAPPPLRTGRCPLLGLSVVRLLVRPEYGGMIRRPSILLPRSFGFSFPSTEFMQKAKRGTAAS